MSPRQLILTLILTASTLIGAEKIARLQVPSTVLSVQNTTLSAALQALINTPIEGQETDNRFTVHNIAKLSEHPSPSTVSTAFLGTSRTKLLQPKLIDWKNTVVSAGNSYNEISYSHLIEAAALKQQFPNLDTIFVEASLLNRQEPPPQFIVSPNHRKYLSVLAVIQDGLTAEPSAQNSAQNIALLLSQQADMQKQSRTYAVSLGPWQIRHPSSQLFDQRDRLKLSTLLNLNEKYHKMSAIQSDIFRQMEEDGSIPFRTKGKNKQVVPTYRLDRSPIQADDPKVTRLSNIKSHYPWDDQYQALAAWAKLNNVTIVFFQPPVRSDFYAFQEKYGLALHRQEMAKLSDQTGFPFIDLNTQPLGYADDWTLFSDADHLGTCKGNSIYLMALQTGLKQWQEKQTRLPKIKRDTNQLNAELKATCAKLDRFDAP